VTASDLARIYPNRLRAEGADLAIVRDVAERLAREPAVDFMRDRRGRYVSPAEQFSLMTSFLVRGITEGRVPDRVEVGELFGPSEPPPATAVGELPWRAFRDALRDAADDARVRGQVPAVVFAGVEQIAPADFLRAAAGVALAA